MLGRGKKQDIHDDDDSYSGKKYSMGDTEGSGSLQFMNILSLDLRSLALFRVAISLLVLLDVINRSTNSFSHYASLGVWPDIEAIIAHDSHAFSLNFINGNTTFQIIVFIVTGLISLSLLLGYKSRWSTCILWALVVSIQNRNVLLLNNGDDLLRVLLFWSMFLPLGARYSVDSVLSAQPVRAAPPASNKYLAIPSAALILQFICYYWVNYILKTGVEWEEGTALYYALSIDQYTTRFGYFLLRFPMLLVVFTQGYLFLELGLPFLIISPFAHGLMRITAVSLMLVFHLGLGLSMELGLYTWVPAVGSLALLPSLFWDRTLKSITLLLGMRHYSRGLVLYYDADIPVTRTMLSIACTFLGLHPPLLAAQQSNDGVEGEAGSAPILRLLKDQGYCWMVVDSTGKRFTGHSAFLALLSDTFVLSSISPILSKLSFLFKIGYAISSLVLAILPLEDMLSIPQYSLPTARRSAVRIPSVLRKIRVADLVCLFFAVYIAWWNIGKTNGDLDMSGGMKTIATALRIDQQWNMFAPFPMKDDGWFIIPAHLANGKEVDLFKQGEPVSYEKPKYVSKTYEDIRWRRYMMNLWTATHADKRLFFGRYLCRQWNWYGEGKADPEYALKTFRLIFMREITLPNYKIKGPDAIVLWEHQC